ncbi:MAG: FtsX-like permease family protein [Terriglobales bacterium]
MGLRLALGAQRRDAVSLVLRQGLWLSAIGLAVGALGAWFAARLLASQLYHVRPGDPFTFLAAVALLALVAAAACYVPARAARPRRSCRSPALRLGQIGPAGLWKTG